MFATSTMSYYIVHRINYKFVEQNSYYMHERFNIGDTTLNN
jgi:hypothetical protein